MRHRFFTAIFFICLAFVIEGCTMVYDAYLRNFTGEKAMVDVYIHNKGWMETLPNRIDIAKEAVAFKSGFRNKINETQLVRWIDTSHFQFELLPNSTADFTDMAGKWVLHGNISDLLVIVTSVNGQDTIVKRRQNTYQVYSDKLSFKGRAFARPIYYYDVK